MAEIKFTVKEGGEDRSAETTIEIPSNLPVSKTLIGQSIVDGMEEAKKSGLYSIEIS